MWKIFNHGQIHGLVHIIIIFSPHPHKVRDAVRDLRRFFCFHLSSSLFYSYTKLHHFFSDTRHGKGCFFHSISKTLAKAPRSLPLLEGKAAQKFGVQSISSLNTCCKRSGKDMHEIVGIRLTLPYYESYASSCTPFTARPLGSFMFLKAASHARASAVEHATLGTLGTLRAALSLGKCSWKMLR